MKGIAWLPVPVVAAVLVATVAFAAETKSPADSGEAQAQRLVAAALESELGGAAADRPSLLRQAIEAAPDYPPARWQAGYVRYDGQWLATDEVERRAAGDERLAEYRRLRQTCSGSGPGELALARWCRKHDLGEEASVHWRHVLWFQPGNKEAWQALRANLSDEQLAQLEAARTRTQRFLKAKRRWSPIVARWWRMSDNSVALAKAVEGDMAGVSDWAEMAALENVVADRGRDKTQQEPLEAVSLAIVDALGKSPRQWATESLVRHAVLHPIDEVRQAAMIHLKPRPWESFVPVLLAGLDSPIEIELTLTHAPGRDVFYRQTLYREDPRENFASEDKLTLGAAVGSGPLTPEAIQQTGASVEGLRRDAVRRTVRQWDSLLRRGTAIQARVDSVNAVTQERNRRLYRALGETTGVDLEPESRAWWQWWLGYRERERQRSPSDVVNSPQRDYNPTEQDDEHHVVTHEGGYFFSPAYPRVPHTSCFAQGTPVWTLTGVVPIEQIRVGDRVLSQNPETGELAYKPVLEVTQGRPRPMIRVQVGSETITATRGHSFWVSGDGWRMIKQLAPGDPLHGANGVVPVDGLEEIEAAQAWYDFTRNLVVADFNTYFVGNGRLLVHDITPPRPTTALVPGLATP